jgi:AcrR family transcriptional regulator
MNAVSPATSDARIADGGRRELVLAAALDTFVHYGYRKTSMEDVARAAAISRPGLYLLFGSKQELFSAAVTQALDRSLAAVSEVLAGTTRSLRDRLLDAFDHWSGRYIGAMSREVNSMAGEYADMLGPAVAEYSSVLRWPNRRIPPRQPGQQRSLRPWSARPSGSSTRSPRVRLSWNAWPPLST